MFLFYFPSDIFLNDLESRRIWVEGGDPSGAGNFYLPPYNTAKMLTSCLKLVKIGYPCPSSQSRMFH